MCSLSCLKPGHIGEIGRLAGSYLGSRPFEQFEIHLDIQSHPRHEVRRTVIQRVLGQENDGNVKWYQSTHHGIYDASKRASSVRITAES